MILEVRSHDLLCPTPPGDYDALLVLMLLPRLTFKADLVIDQLKQQVRNLHSCYIHVTTRVVVWSCAQTLDVNHLYFEILFKTLTLLVNMLETFTCVAYVLLP